MSFALPSDVPWEQLLDASDPALTTEAGSLPYLVADRCEAEI